MADKSTSATVAPAAAAAPRVRTLREARATQARNDNGAIAAPQLPLSDGSVAELPIDDLAPAPFQHRIENAESAAQLQELAASLAQDGQLEPIIVRPLGAPAGAAADSPHKYQIVVGHRRVAALKLNGATTVRAEVVTLDDEQSFRAALIDNMKRHDLDPLDEARTFHYGISAAAGGWTVEQLARWIGRPVDFVAGRLRLLKLDPSITKLLEAHTVSVAVAELLQTVAVFKGALPQLVKRVKPGAGATLRDIEREVEDVFRTHSIELDGDTPFAWKEECARLGCLAKNGRGKPVCLSRENYVRLTVELNKDAIAAAVEKFRAAHKSVAVEEASEAGGAAMPVYYDLSGVEPGWKPYGYRPPPVKGFPPPPPKGGRGTAAHPAKGLLVTVPGTRAAFAQGKIPVEVLKPPAGHATDRYGSPVKTPQTAEAKAKTESRADQRRRQTLALQPPLQAAMMAAVDALAKKPARALAAGMVTRWSIAEDLKLEAPYQTAMEALRIKLPLGSNTGDGLVTRLAALGEAKLVRIIAAAKVWKLDDPFTYLAGSSKRVISAKRLKGQLPLLLGAKAAATVLRDVEELQSRMGAEARTASRKAAKKPTVATKTTTPASKKPKAKANRAAKKASPRKTGTQSGARKRA